MATFQTPSGKALEIEIVSGNYDVTLNATCAGHRLVHASIRPLTTPTNGATHGLSAYGNKVTVGLDADTAAAIQAELDAAIAAHPRLSLERRIDERRGLVAEINGWEEAREHRSNRAWERGDEAGAFIGPALDECRDNADHARRRLAEFDAANPDVLAELEKRRERDIQSALWR